MTDESGPSGNLIQLWYHVIRNKEDSADRLVVLGDGRCLFRSIAAFLYPTLCTADRYPSGELIAPILAQEDNLKADLLRAEVCNVLIEHEDLLHELSRDMPFLLDKTANCSFLSIRDRIKAMKSPSTFAGNVELLAVAYILRRQLHIYERTGSSDCGLNLLPRIVAKFPNRHFAFTSPVMLEYSADSPNNPGHFNLLISKTPTNSGKISDMSDLKMSVREIIGNRSGCLSTDRAVSFREMLEDHTGFCNPSISGSAEAEPVTAPSEQSSDPPDIESVAMTPMSSKTESLADGEISKKRNYTSETSCTPTDLVNDIGFILDATMSIKEIETSLSKLSDGQKYNLLVHHWKPSTDYIFPSTFMNGCNRSCSYSWLKRYPWLVYSQRLDGIFCISCALMTKDRENKGLLVNKPFTRWTKLSDTLKTHSLQESHYHAMQDAANFKAFVEKPADRITVLIDNEKQSRIETNRHLLQIITQVLLLCGRQCIALRGSVEKITDVSHNPGNFLAILKFVAEHDPLVKQHILHPQGKNSQYLSPQIQNELIGVIGDNIRDKILAEVKEATFFAVMADEVDCHNQEQMPLCVRFVDVDKNIREEFLEFCALKRITGEAISGTIKASLEKFGLDFRYLRGQCYDGAASMAGVRSGVQAIIRRDAPDAVYVHCAAHCLNLVIAHSSSITAVDNMLKQLKEVHLFFNYSPKREGLLKSIIEQDVPGTERRRALLQICATRWAARQDSYRHFYQAYVYVVRALEVIAHNMWCNDLQPEFRGSSWDPSSKATAASILHAITSFQFIVTFLVVYMTLDRLDGLTRKLQGRALDILHAYKMVSTFSLNFIQKFLLLSCCICTMKQKLQWQSNDSHNMLYYCKQDVHDK